MRVITNPIANIPKLKNSHVRGWSKIWSDQLGADINHKCDETILNYDTVFIEHGVNFGGTLNLFGGATEELFNKINTLAKCKNIISLDTDMPYWGQQLRKRIGAATTYAGINNHWCDYINGVFHEVKCLRQEDLIDFDIPTNITGITVGDSHSNAYSDKNDLVFRTNGQTLFGMLKTGLEAQFRNIKPFGKITLSYGSIDIRHHLLRHDLSVGALVKQYVNEGKKLEQLYDCDVFFAAPVPVEHEERKIPKTGFYKGTPYFGSREERSNLTKSFISNLEAESGGKIVMPPHDWYIMDPREYAERFMEHSSSVHISPEFYRRLNWGQNV